MKKVMIAVAAVLCLGLTSCGKKCTCTVTSMGITQTVMYTEKELQEKGVTNCEQMAQYVKIADDIFDEDVFKASCK